MGKRKQNWSAGDCFAIPLRDGRFMLGQVLRDEREGLPKVSCALFNTILDSTSSRAEPKLEHAIAILFTTADLLDRGYWKVVQTTSVVVPQSLFPFESLRKVGFVGAKTYGSGNVNHFANAFLALDPWDDSADPEYLDKLLLSPDKKPSTLLFKKDMSD